MKTTLLKVKAGYLIFTSEVHEYSHKNMFNFLITKEGGTVKIVNDLACEIIGTKTINITERDGKMHTLKAVQYVPGARYNLIFIRVLDK